MDKKIAKAIIQAFRAGNKLLICGNGGSATMADHFAAEFVCQYQAIRRALPAISLTSNTAILTAWSNDVDFCDVFARQVEAYGKKGDILITISTSGRSVNNLEAIAFAKKIGIGVIDFPRCKGTVGDIQDYQQKLMHKVCEIVENAFI